METFVYLILCAQNAGRQEYWQSLTDRSCHKSRTRRPARYNSQLKIQPRNTYGVSHRCPSTRRRDDDGIGNQLINTVSVFYPDKQVKVILLIPHICETLGIVSNKCL